MGYRSDVMLAAAFKSKAERDEVMAIYAIDPLVQKHDLLKSWKLHDDDEAGVYVVWYQDEYLKWYESFEDVQGMEHLQTVASDFSEHRGFRYAWHKYRLGEEMADTEFFSDYSDPDGDLQDYLWDHMGITRELRNEFAT
jgi:hypothetical protein